MFAALLDNEGRKMIDGEAMSTPTTDLAKTMTDAWNAGETERVIALATQADTEDEGVLVLLGLAQQATGRHRQAAVTFRRLAQMRPGVSAYWNNLAVACRQAGDLPASEQALLTARVAGAGRCRGALQPRLALHAATALAAGQAELTGCGAADPHFIEARLQAAYACYVCGDNTQQEAMLSDAIDWPAQPAEQALVLSAMLSSRATWTQRCTRWRTRVCPTNRRPGSCVCASPRSASCCTKETTRSTQRKTNCGNCRRAYSTPCQRVRNGPAPTAGARTPHWRCAGAPMPRPTRCTGVCLPAPSTTKARPVPLWPGFCS